jgi:hypothetical protein
VGLADDVLEVGDALVRGGKLVFEADDADSGGQGHVQIDVCAEPAVQRISPVAGNRLVVPRVRGTTNRPGNLAGHGCSTGRLCCLSELYSSVVTWLSVVKYINHR